MHEPRGAPAHQRRANSANDLDAARSQVSRPSTAIRQPIWTGAPRHSNAARRTGAKERAGAGKERAPDSPVVRLRLVTKVSGVDDHNMQPRLNWSWAIQQFATAASLNTPATVSPDVRLRNESANSSES